jgi:hypothetical protein
VTIKFEGSTATIVRVVPAGVRRWAPLAAAGIILCGIIVVASMAGLEWALVVGIFGIALGAIAVVVAVIPDRCIVFDAERRVVTIARRFPWQSTATQKVLPFSAVFSIGVNQKDDPEGSGKYHVVVLRLNAGRSVTLWELNPPRGSERELYRFIAAEPDLTRLQRMTGLRREDRLD